MNLRTLKYNTIQCKTIQYKQHKCSTTSDITCYIMLSGTILHYIFGYGMLRKHHILSTCDFKITSIKHGFIWIYLFIRRDNKISYSDHVSWYAMLCCVMPCHIILCLAQLIYKYFHACLICSLSLSIYIYIFIYYISITIHIFLDLCTVHITSGTYICVLPVLGRGT